MVTHFNCALLPKIYLFNALAHNLITLFSREGVCKHDSDVGKSDGEKVIRKVPKQLEIVYAERQNYCKWITVYWVTILSWHTSKLECAQYGRRGRPTPNQWLQYRVHLNFYLAKSSGAISYCGTRGCPTRWTIQLLSRLRVASGNKNTRKELAHR